MTAYDVLITLVTIISVVSGFAGYAGYTVNGVPQGVASLENPGVFGIVEWLWESGDFILHMAMFSVDDVPAFMSGIFLLMILLAIFLLIRVIRGNS